MEDLIYSIRYKDPDYWDDPAFLKGDPDLFEDEDDEPPPVVYEAGEMQPREESEGFKRLWDELEGVEYVPLVRGIKKADSLIAKLKAFSVKHRISTDITSRRASVCGKLYFGAELLSGERKTELVELLRLADQITAIAHPRGIKNCQIEVVLSCITHRRFQDGREIMPL